MSHNGVRQCRLALKFFLIGVLVLLGCRAHAAEAPLCPALDSATYPAFAATGEAPSFSSWRKLRILPSNCHVSLTSKADLSVALAASFEFDGTIEDIAKRLGAISQSQGLVYWSVTNKSWRSLVNDAFALNTENTKTRRPDFSGAEILSGNPLYFAQNDSQSWGLNVFEYEALNSSADHVTLKSQSQSSIRFGPITVFEPGDVVSVLFINRVNNNLWSYYSLAVIKDSALPINEKSIINRQAALYRNFVGIPLNKDPPLAP